MIRRSRIGRNLLVVLGCLAVYVVCPVPGKDAPPVLSWLLFAAGVGAIGYAVAALVRRRRTAPEDNGVRLEALVALVYALVVFFAAVAMIMYFFYSGTGAKRPFVDSGEYTATVKMKDVDNLVMAGQVQIAGVRVGQVRSVERLEDGGLEVEFALDEEQAPLHEGARLRLAERSRVGETYLALTDGAGSASEGGA